MLRAGIDIGTNTILLLIAEVENNTVKEIIHDEVTVVRLGQGVDKTKKFADEAIERAKACFAKYQEIIAKYPEIPVKAVATSASRDVTNASTLFKTIKDDYGIEVEIISGEDEARFSFLGSLSNKEKPEEYSVLDIGGGSSEFVYQSEHGTLNSFSFDMGCVRCTERFLTSDPIDPAEMIALCKFVRAELEKQEDLFKQLQGKKLLAVAGTATYIASAHLNLLKFDPLKVDDCILQKADVDRIVLKFSELTAQERFGLGGMDEGRADVILAGAVILQILLEFSEHEEVEISTRGLRFGLVLA